MSEIEEEQTSSAPDDAFKVPQFKPLAIKKPVNKPDKSPNKGLTPTNENEDDKSEHQDENMGLEKGDQDNAASSNKSPAEILNEQSLPLPYKEPSWSNICDEDYGFEVLKDGVINSMVKLNGKSFIVFGRVAGCDNILYHPSISRYHAVIQYR